MSASHAWVSTFRQASDLVLGFATDRTDPPHGSAQAGLPVARSTCYGAVPPREALPTAIWPTRSRRKTLPPLFTARAFVFVNEGAAAVIGKHDLGKGALVPVAVLDAQRQEHGEAQVYCWIFGHVRRALDAAASRLMDRREGPGGARAWLHYDFAEGDLVLAPVSDPLPAAWFDPLASNAVFLNASLGDALAAAGFARAFRLHRVRALS